MERVSKNDRALFFECSRAQLAPYRDQLRLFRDGEIFPGVMVVKVPGHAICLIGSGPETLLMWDDTVHVSEVQMAFPHTGVENSNRFRLINRLSL